MNYKNRNGALSILFILGILFCMLPMTVSAETRTVEISGKHYEFGEKDHYKYDAPGIQGKEGSNLGAHLTLTGNLMEETAENGVTSFSANGEDVTLSFTCLPDLLNAAEDKWHLVEDKTKEVGGIKLSSDIKKGAVIVLVSADGKTWVTDYSKTNVLSDSPEGISSFYIARKSGFINGKYYRVIVAYEVGIKTGESKILMVTTNQYDYKKYAAVYDFYLDDPQNAAKAGDTTRSQKLGVLNKTGHDNGYSGIKDIDIKDPHYGWSIGEFFISGYTRPAEDKNGNLVVLKNVGDQITLWFNLKQNIDKLNGNENLSIAEDGNGYDKNFQTPKMNMGRGTLIIRYTDHQGVAHEPEIYTNYLAANARTNADTIVKLFEEGDYEVALDYEVKSIPRKIGNVNIVPEYNNYRITFKFAVRNGNCMVYPFDLKTGAELSNKDITTDGFRLDLAKSRYLDIDVKRTVLTKTAGNITEDVRFNRPAKDGDEYTDEGMYTFDVKNQYTGEHTTKVIYVGTDEILQTLAATGYSVSELNAQLQ